MTIMSNPECLYRSLGLNVGILSRESRVVSEEEGSNDDTMAEGEEGRDEVIWMDGEDDPPDELRYNREGNKIVALPGSMQKTVFKREISTIERSEVKAAIQLCSLPHRQSL